MTAQPDGTTADVTGISLLMPIVNVLDQLGEGTFAQGIKTAALADPIDADPYVLGIAVAAASGCRDLALECMRKVQNTFPNMPLARSKDFLVRQKGAVKRGIPPIMLNTQFKSGSMFLSRRLADALSVPYCYISRTPLDDGIVPEWLAQFAVGGAMCQEHLNPDPKTIALLAASDVERMVVHVRDPRQSMISALHHYISRLDSQSADGYIMRAEMPPGYRDWPLSDRAEHYLQSHLAEQIRWIAGWVAAADQGSGGLEIMLTQYAMLRGDPDGLFAKILDFFRVSPDLVVWDRLEGTPKEGDLHYRKGDVEEWRRVLSPDQARRATEMIPETLRVRFGWPD